LVCRGVVVALQDYAKAGPLVEPISQSTSQVEEWFRQVPW
jgi:hypothetical protein